MWPFSASYPEQAAQDVAGKEFDYIVVGGGTAGCVVASRLSEDPNVSVLVLERGKVNDALFTRIPLVSQGEHANDQRVIRKTPPISNLGGRSLEPHTSESLGGASRINSMLWNRGVPACYNEWAEMGHADWSWEKVEPYFIKAESAGHQPEASHRGHKGPMHLTQHEPIFETQPHFNQVAASLGFPVERDANCPTGPAMGYFCHDYAIMENGNRGSTYVAYLPKELALRRQANLTVCTGVIATKLDLDVKSRRVAGVHIKCSTTKKDFYVKAGREVIVTNGALRTPQLLMLSGIGPSKYLESQGIPVRLDLPGVGSKLYDHHAFPVLIELPLAESYHRLLISPLFGLWHLLLFIFWRAGWMRSSVTPTSLWVNTTHLDDDTMTIKAAPGDAEFDASKPENNPDVEIMFFAVGATASSILSKTGLQTLHVTSVRPQTHGQVELASSNPEDDVVIQYNMFEEPQDRIVVRKALRLALHFIERFQASTYRHAVKLHLAPNVETGTSWRDVTDEELDDYMKNQAVSSLHFSSSCPLGREREGGVVNEQLKVHGLDNLRIADASIFPKIPSCHTMGPTVMVAERCADFVKHTWS